MALSLVSVALAGCAYHPGGDRPPVELPASLTGHGTQDAPAAWPAVDWWRGFNSAELDRLIAEAEGRNMDLAAAAARIAQARALARVAGAPLLPAIGAGGDGLYQSYNDSNGGISGAYGDATLTATYELDLWGRNSATHAAAKASLTASRFDRETVALTTLATVADSYFQILSARERLALARDNLANARSVLKLVEARGRAGEALARDIAEQRALVATQEAAIPPLEQAETAALVALALLVDRPAQGFSVAGVSLNPIASPAVGPGLPSGLLTRRPDIASAEAQLAAADANVAAARAAMLPQINLTAAGGLQGASVGSGTGALYSLTAGLTQPILDNGALAGQRDHAVARRAELVAGYRKAVAAALGDVETALKAIDRLSRQAAAQDEVVRQARRAFDLDQVQYRDGAEDLLSVLDTQRTLFAAEDQRAQLRLARLQALVGLYKALGGGWKQGDPP